MIINKLLRRAGGGPTQRIDQWGISDKDFAGLRA
jgi:hypothetical protein